MLTTNCHYRSPSLLPCGPLMISLQCRYFEVIAGVKAGVNIIQDPPGSKEVQVGQWIFLLQHVIFITEHGQMWIARDRDPVVKLSAWRKHRGRRFITRGCAGLKKAYPLLVMNVSLWRKWDDLSKSHPCVLWRFLFLGSLCLCPFPGGACLYRGRVFPGCRGEHTYQKTKS